MNPGDRVRIARGLGVTERKFLFHVGEIISLFSGFAVVHVDFEPEDVLFYPETLEPTELEQLEKDPTGTCVLCGGVSYAFRTPRMHGYFDSCFQCAPEAAKDAEKEEREDDE